MDFQKKDWQFRDLITEGELNRMEDGIEEGVTKAEQAQTAADQAWGQAVLARSIAELHAARHATGGADPLTPEMIGAVKRSGDTITGSLVVHDGSNYRNIAVKRDHSGGEVGEIRLEVESVAGIGVHVTRLINNEISGRLTLRDNAILFNSNTMWHAENLPYETGTWTPRLEIGGAVPLSVTYEVQTGRYTRIGNRVIADFDIILTNKGTATGNVRIGYLPFSPGLDRPRSHTLLAFKNVTLSSNMTNIIIYTIASGQTGLDVYQIGSGQDSIPLTSENLTNTSGLYGQIIYTTSGERYPFA